MSTYSSDSESSDNEELIIDKEERQEYFENSVLSEKDVYLLTVDNNPQFYVSSYEDAKEKMGKIANCLKTKYCPNGYISETLNPDELHIVDHCDLLIISYSRVIYRIAICRVKEMIKKNETVSTGWFL